MMLAILMLLFILILLTYALIVLIYFNQYQTGPIRKGISEKDVISLRLQCENANNNIISGSHRNNFKRFSASD